MPGFTRRRSRVEGHLKAKSFEAVDQIASEALGVQTVEVGAAQIVIRPAIFEDVVDDLQNRMGQRNARTLLTAPRRQASESGCQKAVLGMARRLGRQHQRASQPTTPLRRPPAASLARTFIVARAD